ncbi:MAG: hypothetical protein ACLFQM_10970 [Fidelibacterota bacterium]
MYFIFMKNKIHIPINSMDWGLGAGFWVLVSGFWVLVSGFWVLPARRNAVKTGVLGAACPA